MGEELRHKQRAEAAGDSEDPTQTGARSRLRATPPYPSERVSSVSALRPEAQTGWQLPQGSGRVLRPSIRPSAFGIPRPSTPASSPPRDAESTPVKRESVPPLASARSASHSIPPRLSQTVRKRAPATAPARTPAPAIKTDIEELLPISHGVKSLPRPPRLPTFESAQLPMASARRIPWASLSVFLVMLGASFVPLSLYRGERRESAAKAAAERDLRAEAEANEPSAGLLLVPLDPAATTESLRVAAPLTPAVRPTQLPAVDQIERAFWGKPAKVREALLEEAEQALQVDDERLAETLFGRALEFDGDFDGDDARAEYGLARVRLAQTDLDGAEGWALVTIRKRPRAAEYRALHAEILQRKGRGPEAQMERAVARALAHFARGTRAR
ncbi:MAG: hypothetical protein JWN04_516 [Myxococcaceae bacterium]|nr:hypothetical protein [Myxococcaceae bacterium]